VSLRAAIAVVRSRWPLVLIPIVLATVVVFVGSADSSTTYDATATLRVTSRSSLLGATVRPDDLAYLDRQLNTYKRLATTKQMLNRLEARVGDGLIDANVGARPSTELLDVTITAEDGPKAVRGANALAHLLIERVETLSKTDITAVDAAFEQRVKRQEQRLTALQRQRTRRAAEGNGAAAATLETEIRLISSSLIALRTTFEENRLAREAQGRTVTLVERATPDAVESVGSGLKTNLVLAILLGGLAGLGLALLAERLQPAPHTVEEIGRELDVPVIGVFPSFGTDGTAQLLEPGVVDTVKRLAAIASARILHNGVRTLAVVSAARGEGRSTVAAGLAVGLAESGRKTLLIDGDFRAPSVHRTFDVRNTFGLSGLLTNPKSTLPRATVPSFVENLDLVPAGTTAVRTMDVNGPRLRRVLKEAATNYEVVVLDTSALLGEVDSLQLASAVDGVLLVAEGRSTRWSTLERVVGQLEKIGARLLGVVGNRWADDMWQDQYEQPLEGAKPEDAATNGTGKTVHLNGAPAVRAQRPRGSRPDEPPVTAARAAASTEDGEVPEQFARPRTLGSD
jgi:capsular exopolysaccharide synthesis family protein